MTERSKLFYGGFKMTNDSNVISGIKCNVDSCIYHSAENRCHAGHITVGGDRCACECCETECNTFKAKA